jgi:hypothetical protein
VPAFLGLLPAVQAQLRILRNGKMSKVVLQLKGPHRLIPSHLKYATHARAATVLPCSPMDIRAAQYLGTSTEFVPDAASRCSIVTLTAESGCEPSCSPLILRSVLQGGGAQLLHIQRLRVHGGDGALPQIRVRQGEPAANTQTPHVQLDYMRSVALLSRGDHFVLSQPT